MYCKILDTNPGLTLQLMVIGWAYYKCGGGRGKQRWMLGGGGSGVGCWGGNASYNLYRYVPSKGGMVLICLGLKSENGHGF